MLGATSRLKGEKDWLKYEKARHLHSYIDQIREDYVAQFKAKEMVVRQRAVALYFIDKVNFTASGKHVFFRRVFYLHLKLMFA